MSIAEQRKEGGRTVIVLRGSFDATEAHRLLEFVASLPRSARVSVDFHEASLVDDFALATLAAEVAHEGPHVELVGLSEHLYRLLRYLHSNAVLH
ncbi:MAG TPA: STAS domain-containing protein [Dongiaceae bacterium]|nr:STAS domain-containing protein [Dongiaceae bacterium]